MADFKMDPIKLLFSALFSLRERTFEGLFNKAPRPKGRGICSERVSLGDKKC